MLRVGTKVRYGVRILVRLALEGRRMSRMELAEAEGLSKPYVFNIARELIAAGFIASHKGRYGGYGLARSPDSITIADVYKAIEGPLALVPCDDGCERRPECTAMGVWDGISAALESAMRGYTIADMANGLKR